MRRINKLTRDQRSEFVFDLINALVLANNPKKSALLLQDLFAEYEIKNISKRLRIAKLLLDGKTYKEIIEEIHCSLATVAKMSLWLEKGGDGLKEIIKNLPKKHERVNFVGNNFRSYRLPEALWEDYLNLLAFSEQNRVEKVMKNSNLKKELFDKIQNVMTDFYKDKKI